MTNLNLNFQVNNYGLRSLGANATHALVLRPTKFGYFDFIPTEVKYKVNEEEDSPVKLGFSSTAHKAKVQSLLFQSLVLRGAKPFHANLRLVTNLYNNQGVKS